MLNVPRIVEAMELERISSAEHERFGQVAQDLRESSDEGGDAWRGMEV